MRQLLSFLFALLTACATRPPVCALHAAPLYRCGERADIGCPGAATQDYLDSLARLGLHDEQPAAKAWLVFPPADSITIEFVATCDGLPDNAGGPVQEGTITLSSLSAGGQPHVEYQLRAHSFDGWLAAVEDDAREEDDQYVFGTPALFREVVLSRDRTVLGARTSYWPCHLHLTQRLVNSSTQI